MYKNDVKARKKLAKMEITHITYKEKQICIQ